VVIPQGGGVQSWYKLGLKRGGAIAVVSVATCLRVGTDGRATGAAIALGAVGPRPFRAREAEATLLGTSLDAGRVALAASRAAQAARPISDVRGSAEYRRAMVEALVTRGLGAAR